MPNRSEVPRAIQTRVARAELPRTSAIELDGLIALDEGVHPIRLPSRHTCTLWLTVPEVLLFYAFGNACRGEA